MPHATRSITPWLVHRRMVPKWLGLAVSATGAILLPHHLWPWLFLGGFLLFFPSEYVVHRWVFHYFADKRAGKVFSSQHVWHHEQPDELDALFNYPPVSIGVGVLYFVVAFALLRDVGGAATFSAGNFFGLVLYEWVHFNAHRPGSKPWTPVTRYLKRYHLWHHYKNENYWFGVTSPVFDHALGSYRDHTEVEHSPTVRTLGRPHHHAEWLDD